MSYPARAEGLGKYDNKIKTDIIKHYCIIHELFIKVHFLLNQRRQYFVFRLFVLFLWHINLYRLFNAKSTFIHINSSISNNSVKHKYTDQLSKTFLFQTIQLG